MNLLIRKNTYRGNRQYSVLSLSTKSLTRKNCQTCDFSARISFFIKFSFLSNKARKIYILIFIVYTSMGNHFFFVIYKIGFSDLLVGNAKLVSFFLLEIIFFLQKQKYNAGTKHCIFLHLYRFFGCFCTHFFDFSC